MTTMKRGGVIRGLWQHTLQILCLLSLANGQCPPRFTEKDVKHFVVFAEHPTQLMFQVRTHTHNITSCRVTKYPSNQGNDEGELPEDDRHLTKDCSSDVSLFGSPPHLTLTMTLQQVTSQDVGKWELMIANHLGSDDVTFWLEINGSPGMFSTAGSPQSPPTNSFDSEDKAGEGSVSDIIIGVVSSLALLIIIATVVVIVLLVKRSRRLRRLRRPPGRQIPDMFREVDGTVPSSHMYDEPEPARQHPTRNTDQRESDKKDYLHPVCFMPPMYPGLDDPPPLRSPRLLAGESELQSRSLSPQYIGM